MRILKHSYRGDKLVVTTNNPGRPDFVYPCGRFITKIALMHEIERSIKYEKVRNNKMKARIALLEADLIGRD